MFFLEWKVQNFELNFHWNVSLEVLCVINNKSASVPVMACPNRDTPLPETIQQYNRVPL